MLENCKSALERWGGVHQLIDRWLDQRRDLLVNLIELKEISDVELEAVTKERIDAFSELLMDYISAGHFEAYPQLREEARAFEDDAALTLADSLLARLENSTALMLDFDDEYASPGRVRQNLVRLPAWLERLAHGLSERFDLEDKLIGRVHARHAPDAARAEAVSRP
ncbi:Rsd/AlgQ family anti-sigma factor [Halomonas halodenitrificans]|uniref:Rsd/AlgQ family anti-sigma factor n=1 Tax=Halomonas halodenitrificans TaxID=28252 RepID=UPI00047FA97F|nr:Rsd/AlgQ family anti-sigma factor [Halomonas halodenitrificans]